MRDAANNRAQPEMWAEPLVDQSSFFSVTELPDTHPPLCFSLSRTNVIPMLFPCARTGRASI